MLAAAEIDFVATNHFSPEASFLFGVLVLFFGGGAVVASLFLRSRALARRTIEETLAAERPTDLSPGPHKMVRGVVEPTDGEEIAIRVEVDQTAKNHTSKNNTWHTWEEVGRRTMARPFYLVTDGGESVLVEPGTDAFVIDDMQTTHTGCGPMGRKRYCDVERGETFSAYGTLARGPNPRYGSAYRDGTGLVLRAPAGERMYLASSSIKDRYGSRIAFMRRWGAVLVPIFVLFHALFTAPYLATSFFGTREPAAVTHHRTWITHGKNSSTTHYGVTVTTDSGHTFEREVSASAYFDLVTAQTTGAKVPTVAFGGIEVASYLGDRATINGIALMIGLVSSGVAVIAFFASYRSKLAWYDRARFSEHGGSGHYHGYHAK